MLRALITPLEAQGNLIARGVVILAMQAGTAVPVSLLLLAAAASRDVGAATALEAPEAGFAILIAVAATFALLEPAEPAGLAKEPRIDPVVAAPLQGGSSDGCSGQVAEGDSSHHGCSVLAPALALVAAMAAVAVVVALALVAAGPTQRFVRVHASPRSELLH